MFRIFHIWAMAATRLSPIWMAILSEFIELLLSKITDRRLGSWVCAWEEGP